jgi:hypothetical protein
MLAMKLRGVWAAVSLFAASAASIAACSSGSSGGSKSSSGDGGAQDGSTSDAVTPQEGASPDASDSATIPRDGGGGTDADLDAGASLDAGDCGLGLSGEALDLSCAGLYSDWATKTIAPGIVQYAPGLQLWSDGAIKTRWIELPPGQKIDTSNMDEWTFPNGTKLWKEFRLPVGDSSTPVRIETRLLWKQGPNNWYRTTYQWSADGETSAAELTLGELDANGAGYEIPSSYECNDCHNGRIDGVMGFEAVGLSAPGTTGITMADLVQQGLVTNPPDASLAVPGDTVESAALGWLHVNCGESCHSTSPGALGLPSGFLTRLDVSTLSSVETTNTVTTGWNQLTQTYQIPSLPQGTTYRMHACDLARSAAYYRPSVRDGVNGIPSNTQMPPIDTHKVDDAGLAILSAWINANCPPTADGGGP